MKAYSTCVGEGPFVAEKAADGEWNDKLRKAGKNLVLQPDVQEESGRLMQLQADMDCSVRMQEILP